MGRQDVAPEFQNFPSAPVFSHQVFDWVKTSEVADWTWSVSGHTAPTAINDDAHGSITLGSGSATDNAYVNGQAKGEVVRMNGLNKIYEFMFRLKLSDFTESDAWFGVGINNVNFMNTTWSDFIAFVKDDGAATVRAVMAKGAASSANYTQQTGIYTFADLNYHNFGIRVQTDAVTLGKGTVSFFIDNALVNTFTPTSDLPHSEELKLSVGLMNGAAAAKTLTMDYANAKLER